MARKLPKLCRHKTKDLAYVTDPFSGKEIYFGKWGSDEARAGYNEWIRALLKRREREQPQRSAEPVSATITVSRLIVQFMEHAKKIYVKNGRPTGEASNYKNVLRFLLDLYGDRPANQIGGKEIEKAREKMAEAGWLRRTINRQVGRLRSVFRWALKEQLIEAETLAKIASLEPLKKGRGGKEKPSVAPVPMEVVEETLPRLRQGVRAIVQIQLLADMRPHEVLMMRPCDIDTGGSVWKYVPMTHKEEHQDKSRVIWLGPKAQEILAPLLRKCRTPDSWIFPARYRSRLAATSAGHYTTRSYRRAIRTACEKKPPLPHWYPHQLRHARATEIRSMFGKEAAQAVLGHASESTTDIYTWEMSELAREVAEKIG